MNFNSQATYIIELSGDLFKTSIIANYQSDYFLMFTINDEIGIKNRKL